MRKYEWIWNKLSPGSLPWSSLKTLRVGFNSACPCLRTMITSIEPFRILGGELEVLKQGWIGNCECIGLATSISSLFPQMHKKKSTRRVESPVVQDKSDQIIGLYISTGHISVLFGSLFPTKCRNCKEKFNFPEFVWSGAKNKRGLSFWF